ncbi:hypothetical protein M0R72_19165 [Candidatus Pacearchaeota archaeon]|jgi:hypothetical protein|nr:hypothetical protein [Candidatus Pacearchaeota archaeon]
MTFSVRKAKGGQYTILCSEAELLLISELLKVAQEILRKSATDGMKEAADVQIMHWRMQIAEVMK